MNKRTVRCPKTGSGIDDDPIRPDLSSIPEIVELHKLLDQLRAKDKEVQNRTFYIVHIKRDLGNEFEVEIILPDDLPPDTPDEVKQAWEKLKKALEQ